MNGEVNVNLHIDDYTNRVLGVIKERFGLKDKSKALMYLAKKCGQEYVEPEVKEEFIREVIAADEAHTKKYGIKGKTLAELRKEIEAD